jgi:hypothetical protein
MRIANNLARSIVLVTLLLGALTVPACGEGKVSSQNNLCADPTAPGCQVAGGDDGAVASCVQICRKADDCCWAATPARDGGLPCDWALSCSDASSNDELIAQCQTFTALFPLNPACQ